MKREKERERGKEERGKDEREREREGKGERERRERRERERERERRTWYAARSIIIFPGQSQRQSGNGTRPGETLPMARPLPAHTTLEIGQADEKQHFSKSPTEAARQRSRHTLGKKNLKFASLSPNFADPTRLRFAVDKVDAGRGCTMLRNAPPVRHLLHHNRADK